MVARSISETKRVRYLLGLSSLAERERIEAAYFEDDDAFQEMLTAEDDLIDAYARGELAIDERRGFEKTFIGSLRGRNRVGFARAFAGTVFDTRSVGSKPLGPLVEIFKSFQSAGLLRIARFATVIVFIAVLAWLVNDRRRMTNELRELRAESAELSKQMEALHPSRDREQTRPTEIRAEGSHEGMATSKPAHAKKPRKVEEVIVDNSFVSKTITQLPLEARNVPSLLTLQTGTTSPDNVAGDPATECSIMIEGFVNTYLLPPRNRSSSGEITIRIPSFLRWIRFQIALETAVIHDEYCVTMKTADGRLVTSIDWFEPLTPNQTIIDIPVMSTDHLPAGDYVLLLTGKQPDDSFVKIAEYPFKVVKYQSNMP